MQTSLSRNDYLVALELAKQVLNGSVFQRSKNIDALDQSVLETVYGGVYGRTQIALKLLSEEAAELSENLLLKVAPKSAAFISIIAFELIEKQLNLSDVIDAGAVMALIQIVDHLMDRGDEKMLLALEHYFGDIPSDDPTLISRIKLMEHIAEYTTRVTGEDASIAVPSALNVLRDEAEVLRMSLQYKAIEDPNERVQFLEKHADKLADLSIRNGGLKPATYMVYRSYLHAGYDMPPIADIEGVEGILRATRLGELAIRLWDDWGDRELDAGQNIYTNAFVINLFLERNQRLTEAYLQDIAQTDYYQRAQGIVRDSSEGINYLMICILREEFEKIHANANEGTKLYLQTMERIIEAGFVNHSGDEAISGIDEVVADYSRAK